MNRKAYYLDLQTLLDYLSVHGESCVLSTTLKERGRSGYVVVRNGAMVSCSVNEGERTVLQGKQAYKMLAQSSEWHVQLQDDPPTPPPSTPSPNFPSFSTNSQHLPIVSTDFPGEQSPALRPSFSSDQLPALRRGTTSGHWPAINPHSLGGQWPAVEPGTSSGHLPVTRLNFPPEWSPRVKRGLSQEEFMALPTRQRMIIRLVLTMINGARSVEDIKAQLQLSPETVENTLAYLRARNIIE